jgi:hypothetical protein
VVEGLDDQERAQGNRPGMRLLTNLLCDASHCKRPIRCHQTCTVVLQIMLFKKLSVFLKKALAITHIKVQYIYLTCYFRVINNQIKPRTLWHDRGTSLVQWNLRCPGFENKACVRAYTFIAYCCHSMYTSRPCMSIENPTVVRRIELLLKRSTMNERRPNQI